MNKNSEFEKEYMITFDERKKELEEKINSIYKSVHELSELSEKYAIPISLYNRGIGLNSCYEPKSLESKENALFDRSHKMTSDFSEEFYDFLEENDISIGDAGWTIKNERSRV